MGERTGGSPLAEEYPGTLVNAENARWGAARSRQAAGTSTRKTPTAQLRTAYMVATQGSVLRLRVIESLRRRTASPTRVDDRREECCV